MDALEVCDTIPVPLPLKVKATNLGYGIWLITSAQPTSNLKKITWMLQHWQAHKQSKDVEFA